ncbi:hypothetical protein BsWGS_21493 [Bradybaena similaris]
MASWNQVSNVISAVTSQIYLVTWNVHGSRPPSHLADLLSLNETQLPDVYAIGLQEMGYDSWENAFVQILQRHDYVKLKSRQLLGICMMLFVKRSHLPYVYNIESEVTKTGFRGMWGNKGASSVRLDFMGMNLIVVNSHLAAHKESIRERIVNIDNILDGQKFRDRDTDNIMDHDYVFWIGDLNFRLENISYNRTLDLIHDEDYKTLAENDQLRLIMEEGLAFEGFHEGELNFPPTYKFNAGTDSYDTSPQRRIPSYTDRILYHFHDTQYGKVRLGAKLLEYRCHPNFMNSDHKPVTAVIDINVMSRGITSPVTFDVGQQPWDKRMSRDVAYNVRKDFAVSISDWIGIYKADFVDIHSPESYVWTALNSAAEKNSPSAIKMVVQFTSVHLSGLPDGRYVLCYLTRKGSLSGISRTFTIGIARSIEATGV